MKFAKVLLPFWAIWPRLVMPICNQISINSSQYSPKISFLRMFRSATMPFGPSARFQLKLAIKCVNIYQLFYPNLSMSWTGTRGQKLFSKIQVNNASKSIINNFYLKQLPLVVLASVAVLKFPLIWPISSDPGVYRLEMCATMKRRNPLSVDFA